jgi:hypothetical protein
MNELLKTLLPYVVCFILGVIVCLSFRGCGDETLKTKTKVIENPKPKKTTKETPNSNGRFLSVKPIPVNKPIGVLHVANEAPAIIHTNTPYVSKFELYIDTIAIIEAWLFERSHYDTTITFNSGKIRLRWQNYQNVSENLVIDYLHKNRNTRFALGIHANAGFLSDFESSYVPLFGLGLQGTIKKTYISANYGFNGNHYVGVGVGYNFINR